MGAYKSPGVYVEEVPSGNAPIVGAGTSTAAFIGVIEELASLTQATLASDTADGATDYWEYEYQLVVENDLGDHSAKVVLTEKGPKKLKDSAFTISVTVVPRSTKQYIKIFRTSAPLDSADSAKPTGLIRTEEIGPAKPNESTKSIKIEDKGDSANGESPPASPPVPAAMVPISCTNFTEFAAAFGNLRDNHANPARRRLAQAVYGFFLNGGTHCYVVIVNQESDVANALVELEALDDISLVCAPGLATASIVAALIAHCEVSAKDRFAILDAPPETPPDSMKASSMKYTEIYTATSNHAALYYPWIQVSDPSGKSESICVPPSGHIAGIYARVDATRGVHKAPANEPILGAVGLERVLSSRQQDLLNPDGINCLRRLNGNLLVWGARTLGGDKNLDVKYVPVRRLLNYLRVSIDKGTQWTVFEPNGPDLWAKVIRNVSAFLKGVWTSGALFGRTPEEAFYVKCDAENNPQASRDNGYLVVEVGVAIVRPAEFVVFKLSQWSGPQK